MWLVFPDTVAYLHTYMYSHSQHCNTTCAQDSPAQFWSEFQGNLSSLNYNRSEALRQSRFVYDAVWAAAYALHDTSELLRRGAVRNTSITLDNFVDDQFREEINKVILESTRNLKFRGVSVSVCGCVL